MPFAFMPSKRAAPLLCPKALPLQATTPGVRARENLRFCRSAARHTVRPAGRFPLAGRGGASVQCSYGENGMFRHIMIGSNDVARSKKFYDALFTAMGAQPGTEDARGRVAYSHNGGRFMISKPIDGKPACHANGGTIGFVMKDAA